MSSVYYGGSADLTTMDPNPSIYNGSDITGASDVSQIANTIGQWGTTIASVVTGHPVSTVATPTGIRTIGASGSTVVAPTQFSQGSGMLLLVVAVVIVILLVKD